LKTSGISDYVESHVLKEFSFKRFRRKPYSNHTKTPVVRTRIEELKIHVEVYHSPEDWGGYKLKHAVPYVKWE